MSDHPTHDCDWICTCGRQCGSSNELLEHLDNCPDWTAGADKRVDAGKSEPPRWLPRADAPPL